MLENRDHALGQIMDLPPLPPHTKAGEVLADCLPILDAPSRITPIECAQQNVRVEARGVWQNYDPDVTPYMVEPANTIQSRLYKGGAFVGPSQSGKTMALITTALHPVICDPSPTLVMHMDKPSRDRWVEESLNPVIHNSPEVYKRLGKGRDDDTFSRKRFLGMRLMLGYPTPQWLSSAKYKLVALTDYDHFPPELGVRKDAPEGSSFDMAKQRVKTFLSRGFVFAESTPAWPVTDEEWEAAEQHPHELPPVKHGIVLLYNEGTRGRWYWECRDCKELYEPTVERLEYDKNLPPIAAGETAVMVCPHCGGYVGPQHKTELNRAALAGRGGWLHETEDGSGLVPLNDSRIRGSEIASWALNGAAATFAKWSELISRRLVAENALARLGDEVALARYYYTDVGVPYHRKVDKKEGELTVQFLKDNLREAERGVAPSWTRFIVITVDVQGSYFPVQITAFGEEGKAQVVDRFDLTQPPVDAPNRGSGDEIRRLEPARYSEDWKVLDGLAQKVVPIEGEDYGLKPVHCIVDFHGEPGVSDNAEKFLKRRRKEDEGHIWRVSRGEGKFKVPFRIKYAEPERGSGGKAARSIRILTMATDRLKDTLAVSLKRATGGAGPFLLPSWMRENTALLQEFVAEQRTSDGWEKKPGQVRNEAIDLSVQARAGAEHKGLLRIDWSAPPEWALGGIQNEFAVALSVDEGEAAEPAREKEPPAQQFVSFLRR
ncbi:phage terminase large subunit family protein [Phaeobacter inhibens]|uniref:phage terminase large subunit family protein n=1 Tax=Phaeobacter inhibens TaxID=221822 RepID=UPI0021A88822|nr:phage terminase large subunit family protein [Phaeobacter inhibens]UWR40237.1 phage terminase large subunit family protein [Phaeobacter inhibens]